MLIFASLTLGSQPIMAQTMDYDTDNDGLIDIRNLAQLNAIRHDVNGSGEIDGNGDATHADWVAAFPNRDTSAGGRMGCPSGTCRGYELMNDLDFDENGNGERDDTYTTGAGWLPLGDGISFFASTFNGNGHVIRNLYINRGTSAIGLFGASESARIENLGLVNVDITGNAQTDGLAGSLEGTITAVYVTGQIQGGANVGGLAGDSTGGTINACYT